MLVDSSSHTSSFQAAAKKVSHLPFWDRTLLVWNLDWVLAMGVRFGRIIAAAVVTEVAGVGILAALVSIFGPTGFKEARPFALRLGTWVGPLSGFLLCILGGRWVARPAAPAMKLLNGFSTGLAAAMLDIAIAVSLGSSVSPLLLVSNAGRLFGGTIGGCLAGRPARPI
jgi:hypothetical protein